MSFAENLQYLRRKNKITQEQLAEELGVSRQSVSKWETGEAYPETEKLIVLCDKFGVTLDGLLRGDVQGKEESAPCEEEAPQDIKEECAPPIKEESEESDGEAAVEQADGDEKACRAAAERIFTAADIVGYRLSVRGGISLRRACV